MRVALPVVCLLAAAGCKADSAVDYDAEYNVTVRSALTDDGALDTNCVDAGRESIERFTYQLVFDAADVGIDIDGEGFASGTRSGCLIDYQSAVWLEDDRSGGLLRWQITGRATYEGAVDGCDLPDGVDWLGTETIEIIESEDEDVPAGCTYELETEGTFIGG